MDGGANKNPQYTIQMHKKAVRCCTSTYTLSNTHTHKTLPIRLMNRHSQRILILIHTSIVRHLLRFHILNFSQPPIEFENLKLNWDAHTDTTYKHRHNSLVTFYRVRALSLSFSLKFCLSVICCRPHFLLISRFILRHAILPLLIDDFMQLVDNFSESERHLPKSDFDPSLISVLTTGHTIQCL